MLCEEVQQKARTCGMPKWVAEQVGTEVSLGQMATLRSNGNSRSHLQPVSFQTDRPSDLPPSVATSQADYGTSPMALRHRRVRADNLMFKVAAYQTRQMVKSMLCISSASYLLCLTLICLCCVVCFSFLFCDCPLIRTSPASCISSGFCPHLP